MIMKDNLIHLENAAGYASNDISIEGYRDRAVSCFFIYVINNVVLAVTLLDNNDLILKSYKE